MRVMQRIWQNQEHQFLFLTKAPGTYNRFDLLAPRNLWLGATFTTANDLLPARLAQFPIAGHRCFASIEPMHGPLALELPGDLHWVIVGAETGNRRGRIEPTEEWIDDLVEVCSDNQIPLFMKDNLQPYWRGPILRQQPEWMR